MSSIRSPVYKLSDQIAASWLLARARLCAPSRSQFRACGSHQAIDSAQGAAARLLFVTVLLICGGVLFPAFNSFGDTDIPTKFTNRESIANTRHNLRQKDGAPGPWGAIMDTYRNDYGEVCVYCHTPHGASSVEGAPLWNRSLPAGSSFTKYSSDSLTQTSTAPSVKSLLCLSCHDGQTAVDSIYNMPGSGRYSASPDTAFLNTWSGNSRGTTTYAHLALNDCKTCHSPGSMVGTGATDFSVFVIGLNLRDDHPIGVRYPGGTPTTTGFNSGTITLGSVTFFDRDGNGRLSKGDPRFYDTGNGPEVECASCHDPHGVPSGGRGSNFIPSFLRVNNAGSGLCQVCHAK